LIFKKVANLNFTNSSVSENYLTLTFHFSNLLNSDLLNLGRILMWQLSEPPNPPPYLPEVTWLYPPINVDPGGKLQGERGAGAIIQPAK